MLILILFSLLFIVLQNNENIIDILFPVTFKLTESVINQIRQRKYSWDYSDLQRYLDKLSSKEGGVLPAKIKVKVICTLYFVRNKVDNTQVLMMYIQMEVQ